MGMGTGWACEPQCRERHRDFPFSSSIDKPREGKTLVLRRSALDTLRDPPAFQPKQNRSESSQEAAARRLTAGLAKPPWGQEFRPGASLPGGEAFLMLLFLRGKAEPSPCHLPGPWGWRAGRSSAPSVPLALLSLESSGEPRVRRWGSDSVPGGAAPPVSSRVIKGRIEQFGKMLLM